VGKQEQRKGMKRPTWTEEGMQDKELESEERKKRAWLTSL
jgi:hypothetical protein